MPHTAAHFFATPAGGYVLLAVAAATVVAVFAASRRSKPVAVFLGIYMVLAAGVAWRSPVFAANNLRGREMIAVILWLPVLLVAAYAALRPSRASVRGGGYSPAYRNY